MVKGSIKLLIIQDATDHWWVLDIVDGFGPQTSSLKWMKTYERYKLFMLKKEGNDSHVCQRYEQDDDNQYKDSFR